MHIVYHDKEDKEVGSKCIAAEAGSRLVTMHLYPGIRDTTRNGVRLQHLKPIHSNTLTLARCHILKVTKLSEAWSAAEDQWSNT